MKKITPTKKDKGLRCNKCGESPVTRFANKSGPVGLINSEGDGCIYCTGVLISTPKQSEQKPGKRTFKLTDVEIIVPDNVSEHQAIEILTHGFLDKLQDCFGTKKKSANGFIKVIHEGTTFFVGDT